MRLCNRSCHPWVWSALLVLLFAVPSDAQPPSPLELVRGLRENGQIDLALEYLKDLEGKPLSDNDKAGILLERAKCLLEASEDEPDEATRIGMVVEAREGLNTFIIKYPKHPRAAEALLTEAKLTSLDAKEQLNRARRMEIPPFVDDPAEKAAREAAMEKQKAEAKNARPMFLRAAKQFNDASGQIRTRLEDKALDPMVRKTLEREAFEAQLAAGINQFNTAETYMPASLITGAEKAERNKFLDQAKDTFLALGKGPSTNRTAWIARAWAAEVTFEQNEYNVAAAEVGRILSAREVEAEDGKRLARFFQLRRNFLTALGTPGQRDRCVSDLRDWLRTYGNPRKPTPEVYSVRFYLARLLQTMAEGTLIDAKTGKFLVDKSGQLVRPNPTAQKQLEDAEKIYRTLAQTDNEYTSRATRQRMFVVRHLMGDADQPVTAFDTFEKAQMASLIQMRKLSHAETLPDRVWGFLDLRTQETKHRQLKTVAILERSRELATPQDNPADVTDVLLRLIYFYRLSEQPYQAAVLGEYVSHTIKSTGGKAALAGLLSLNGYLDASKRAKDDPEARAADRDRAIAMAKFLDEKFPNDNPTDTARHQLATLYMEEKKYLEAFGTLLKVRPAYAQITNARLLEGYLVMQLVTPRDSTLPDEKKLEIFNRAVTDLAKVGKPANVAMELDVRGYISARCRLASLMLAQGRADPAAEKANPGYNQALAIATAVIQEIPTFDAMTETKDGAKKLNIDGMEMMLLAQDVQTRATYLRARAMIDAADAMAGAEKQQKFDEASKALQPIIDLVEKSGSLVTAEMRTWAEGSGGDHAEQKARIAQLAGIVDKTRVDLILTAFRLRVKQGKAAESEALLNLMVKAGGSIENSLPLLEPVGRELAAQVVVLRKEGKQAEANTLAAGLGVLLNKIAKVPNLPQPTVLFVGNMLLEVGKPDDAMAMLKQIPAPDFNLLYKRVKMPDGTEKWVEKTADEIPKEVLGKAQTQLRNYASAQYGIARALRESKKLKEAEDLLTLILKGNATMPDWGAGRLYFRKEMALLYEDKGASIATVKEANVEWGKALREWQTLFTLQSNRLRNPPPGATPQQMIEYRNSFADALFDVNRCLVKANLQLLKDQPPAKLQKTFDDVGKRFADMEKQIPVADWQPEVQYRFVDFLKEVPGLVGPYKAAGGKFFLEKIAVKP